MKFNYYYFNEVHFSLNHITPRMFTRVPVRSDPSMWPFWDLYMMPSYGLPYEEVWDKNAVIRPCFFIWQPSGIRTMFDQLLLLLEIGWVPSIWVYCHIYWSRLLISTEALKVCHFDQTSFDMSVELLSILCSVIPNICIFKNKNKHPCIPLVFSKSVLHHSD